MPVTTNKTFPTRAVLGACLALTAGSMAFAQTSPVRPAGSPAMAAPTQMAALAPTPTPALDPERTIKMYLASEISGLPGRVEISVGALDDRMRLAPCAAVEPFVPAGARLWGKTMLGMRCKTGATWSVLVPVHIKVFAQALVAAGPLQAGQPVSEADVRVDEVDLTRENGPVLTDPSQIGDSILARPVGAGQAMRREFIKPRPVINQGDPVKLVYSGPGFSVSGSGKALTAAGEGQSVRIQLESGKVLSGTVRGGKQVELGL